MQQRTKQFDETNESKSGRRNRIFASELVVDRLEIVAARPNIIDGPGWSIWSRIVVLFTDLNARDAC
jgi:hypothetical protein